MKVTANNANELFSCTAGFYAMKRPRSAVSTVVFSIPFTSLPKMNSITSKQFVTNNTDFTESFPCTFKSCWQNCFIQILLNSHSVGYIISDLLQLFFSSVHPVCIDCICLPYVLCEIQKQQQVSFLYTPRLPQLSNKTSYLFLCSFF